MKELMTTQELAEFLEVSPRTLESWRYKAEGPGYITLGRRAVRYRADDVRSWLDGQAAA